MNHRIKCLVHRKQLHFAAAFVIISIGVASLSNRSIGTQRGSVRADEPPANAIKKNASSLRPDLAQNEPARRIPMDAATTSADVFDERDATFERESKELAKKYRSAPRDEQPNLGRELQALADRHFEYRQRQRKDEIERLSDRIDALRVIQLRRQQNKAEVLKRRFNDLIDPHRDLSWEDPKDPLADSQLPPKESQDPVKETERGPRDVTNLPSAEPTYEGMTLDDALKLLENERSNTKLMQAIMAVSSLSADAEPQRLVRAIFRMAQSTTSGNGFNEFDLTGLQLALLWVPPIDVALDQLTRELKQTASRKPSPSFKKLVTSWFGTASRFPSPESEDFASIGDLPDASPTENQPSRISVEAWELFRNEVRRRSHSLIRDLVMIADKDPAQGEWVVETARYILELSEQRLTTHPNLIPIVERVLVKSKDASAKRTATALLAQSGLHLPEFLKYLEQALQQNVRPTKGGPLRIDERYAPYLAACNWSIQLAADVPQTVTIVTEELGRRWTKMEADLLQIQSKAEDLLPPGFPEPGDDSESRPNNVAFLYLIETLGEIGEPAKLALPLLNKIKHAAISNSVFEGAFSGAILNGKRFEVRKLLEENVASAIRKIEEAISNSGGKMQSEQDAVPSTAERISTRRALPADDDTSTSAGTDPVVERTFDGKPYWQWLKLLESEVKPERLADAIDACSRLAQPQDEHRIVRDMFLAANLFETDTSKEGEYVRIATEKSLCRLPSEVVVDELVTALRDQKSYRSGRMFQARFLAGLTSKPIIDKLKSHADEVIGELVKLISRGGDDEEYLLCAATTVWAFSNRPLSEFEPLQQLILKMIDRGPTGKYFLIGNMVNVKIWNSVATKLIQKAPETPGLALMLMKHAGNNIEVIEFVGKMGRHAKDAAPLLVDQFLEQWKTFENRDYQSVREQATNHRNLKYTSLIRAIGEIGDGKTAHHLLRELGLIALPRRYYMEGGWEDEMFKSAAQGLTKFSPDPESETGPPLLHDKTLINGHWDIGSVFPYGQTQGNVILKDYQISLLIRFKDGPLLGRSQIEKFSILTRFEIDETKTPKQISLRADETLQRQFGIYELTETSLRIQLAKINEPRPLELVSDKTKLPDGQLLLELKRSFSVPLDKAAPTE